MFGIAWGGNEFTPLLVMYRQAGQSAASVDTLLFAYVLGIIPPFSWVDRSRIVTVVAR